MSSYHVPICSFMLGHVYFLVMNYLHRQYVGIARGFSFWAGEECHPCTFLFVSKRPKCCECYLLGSWLPFGSLPHLTRIRWLTSQCILSFFSWCVSVTPQQKKNPRFQWSLRISSHPSLPTCPSREGPGLRGRSPKRRTFYISKGVETKV